MAEQPTLAAQIFAALKPLGIVYRNTAPTGTPPPWLIFTQVGGRDMSTYDPADPGACYRRFQIDAWATDATAADRLSNAARTALRAALMVGEITDNPSQSGEDNAAGMELVSFDVIAWM